MTITIAKKCPWCDRGVIRATGVLCRVCGGTGKAR